LKEVIVFFFLIMNVSILFFFNQTWTLLFYLC
jgi:hypothetical protein